MVSAVVIGYESYYFRLCDIKGKGAAKISVKVKIPLILRQFTNGQEVVEVPASNALECLHNLTAQFPSLRRWLYNKQGELRPQVWFFVNGERINRERINADELTNPLRDGDELLIMLAVAGG
ncbi:hypothetical protein ES703_122782 [subsurface metagenome]